MDTNDINECLDGIPGFLGTHPCDELPEITEYPACLTLNTDPHYRPGEHWQCIYIDAQKKGDFFCSFAQKPQDSVIEYLNKYTNKWSRNRKRVQALIKASKACGHFSTIYLTYKCLGHSNQKFLNLFKKVKNKDQLAVKSVKIARKIMADSKRKI